VGSPLRSNEVLSRYAQRRKRFVVQRLDRFDRHTSQWAEAIVEDHRTPIPDQVAFRIDFPQWLSLLNSRNRRIAMALAMGNPACQVAKRFKLSQGRISQLRSQFYLSWQMFHGEPAATAL
jgi:hypothetical protein